MSDRCPNNKHVTHDCNCITTSIDQWFKGYPIAYKWVTALWSRVFNNSTKRTASLVPPIYVKISSNVFAIVELDFHPFNRTIKRT